MWLGFDSRTRRHKWAEFVGSLLCSERFFSRYSGFPLSSKTNIWFDLIWFDLICVELSWVDLNCFDLKGDTLDRDNLWYLLFMVSMFTSIRTNKVLLLICFASFVFSYRKRLRYQTHHRLQVNELVCLFVLHSKLVWVDSRISLWQTNYRDSSSGRMIRLKAHIYTQTNYHTNYRSLPKFVPDG